MNVTVILLSFNGAIDLSPCLESLMPLPENCQLLVVDNGSVDNSVEIARGLTGNVVVIENGVNYGFSGGMNIGLQLAMGMTTQEDVNIQRADEGPAIEVVAFDDIINQVTENGKKRVKLVKIDCEGSEYPILLTARTLHLVDAICGEFHEMGGAYDAHTIPEHARVPGYERFTIQELVDMLQQAGFSISWTRHGQTNMGHFFAVRDVLVQHPSSDTFQELVDMLQQAGFSISWTRHGQTNMGHFFAVRDVLVQHPSSDTFAMPNFITSKLCVQKDFYTPWYSRWARAMKEPLVLHRKQWEFVIIAQSLAERGNLQAGKRGLGFGVGQGPLPALLASYGCAIVATDLNEVSVANSGWNTIANNNLQSLNRRHLCDDALFQQRVSLRALDMNHIPHDVVDFDFSWSSCAMEHLGSIENGIHFILRQMECLKPGGWAAHTTEFNVSSNQATVDQGPTVLFRRQDIERMVQRLRDAGHVVADVDFYAGNLLQDFVIDVPPYTGNPHLKLALGQFVTTSILILVQKR